MNLTARIDGRASLWWLKVLPFFISAVLFMSGIFAVFAPIPLTLLFFNSKRQWAWMAALSNAAIVFAMAGTASVIVYTIFILGLALSLPEFLRPNRSLERSAIYSLLVVIGLLMAVLMVLSFVNHVNPIAQLKGFVSGVVDYLTSALTPEMRKSWFDGAEPAELKEQLLVEMPSAIGIFSLLLLWLNLVVLIRVNPGSLREKIGVDVGYLKRWKAPEILIWPTILTGFLVVFPLGIASDIARNVFKFLMAVYAIQGLSILSFVFEAWGVKGFFRTAGYLISIFLMMPLLLSLGFFDLWFDFRAKLRQS